MSSSSSLLFMHTSAEITGKHLAHVSAKPGGSAPLRCHWSGAGKEHETKGGETSSPTNTRKPSACHCPGVHCNNPGATHEKKNRETKKPGGLSNARKHVQYFKRQNALHSFSVGTFAITRQFYSFPAPLKIPCLARLIFAHIF